VSKAIDKASGAVREVKKWNKRQRAEGSVYGDTESATSGNLECPACGKWKFSPDYCKCPRDSGPATEAARQWFGWGTALKPAWEPIIVARKPLVGTVAKNVLTHGTGAMNVDRCRVADPENAGKVWTAGASSGASLTTNTTGEHEYIEANPAGRWPANLIHDGSEEVESLTGSAARFFYCAKASKADRDEGCEILNEFRDTTLGNGLNRVCAKCGSRQLVKCDCGAAWILPPRLNHHPTVKPTDLMRYLCRLVTPPGGVVLDPFMGSGSTGKAAILEGFSFVGIERESEYLEIARARIEQASKEAGLFPC
jgi:site-specific DNA-methyltransferase (adenine-specific)